MTRSLVGAAAAVVGFEAAEGAFTEVAAVGFTEVAIEVARVLHIPSRAARGVPDIQLAVVPVVRVTQSLVAPVVR